LVYIDVWVGVILMICLEIFKWVMKLFKKLIGVEEEKCPNNYDKITLFLDAEFSQRIEIGNQTVAAYVTSNQLDEDQFLYICIQQRKSGETVLKRKLCGFENLGDCLRAEDNA
jgi:hypothetical protein